jgi:ABC-2 type transport system permease protein
VSATTAHATGEGVTFVGILRSEWIKLVTLRSTGWCYLILVVVTIGLGALVGLGMPSAAEMGVTDRVSVQTTWLFAATLGVGFAQLVVAVLGALVITGEYGTGMIRSTFAAVPARIPALVGKALVFGAITFVLSFGSLVVTALLLIPLFAGKGIEPDIADGHVWLALVGAAGYLALIGLLSLAIGTIIRHSAGGIAAALGLLLVLPTIAQLLAGLTQAQWASDVGTFLPSSAGGRMFAYPVTATEVPPGFEPPPGAVVPLVLEPWQGLLVLLGWLAVTAALGVVLLRRRDA